MMVSGLMTPGSTPSHARLSEDALAALRCGDVDALLKASHARWGSMVMMADENDDDKDDTGGDGGDDGGDGSDSGGSDDDDKGSKDDDNDARLERMERRMKAADKRASEAEAALQKIKDAEKSDLEKAQGEREDLQKQVEDLQSEVSTLRLQNAFLTANKHTWHDPDTALALAQSKGFLDGVTDEDTGDVDKKELSKALDRLAKDHAYLVKTDKKDDDGPGGPSGEPAGGRSDNGKDEKAKEQKLRQRFPALSHR